MKIVELKAENVKRLKAVEITPQGELVVIGGKNAAGKSSVLDSIWLALGGGKAGKETPLPIRDGENRASVRLDLGELVVTRSWTRKGTSLKVENSEGAQYKSPQGMLDALVGQLSFDPLAFTRLSPKDQREALLGLVDVNLDEIDEEIRRIYEDRTSIGRQGKSIGDVDVDDTLPTEETSATDLINQVQVATDKNAQIDQKMVAKYDVEARINDTKRLLANLEKQYADLTTWAISQDAEPVDVDALREQLSTIEETNAKIRANNMARDQKAWKDRLRQKYAALTDRLTELDEQKAAALAAAEFPVDGLSFDDSGVTYKNVPLSQASSAEQIRVSLAMGMALNPRLKVLMIKDGSLLDSDSMAAIHEQIRDGGHQLWIERVGDADQGAVILEDGEIA